MSRAVAALGDSALLLPASLLLFCYLAGSRRMPLALVWALSLAATGATTLGAKLLFHACGPTLTDLDVISPSGHASFAIIFYGALALMVGTGRSRTVAFCLAAGLALLVVAIALSRIRTGAHSPAEVAIGMGIGSAGLALFAALHARTGRPVLPWPPLAIGFALTLLVLGGLHFSLEHTIGRVARRVSAVLDVCAEPPSPSPASWPPSSSTLSRP